MAQSSPIHDLRDHLQEALSQSIAETAEALAQSGTVSSEALHRIAHLRQALLATSAEIDAHMPKLGSGSEEPLS
ncbi:MAG: hypothetical protein WDN04_20920 [Rhodospirillales bacterium]